MINTKIYTLSSINSEQSTDNDSLPLNLPPQKRRNPKLENMRTSLKNSLFNPEKSHSVSVIPISATLLEYDEQKNPSTSDPLDRSYGTPTYGNSNMEKYRQLIKANLFPAFSKANGLFEKQSDLLDENPLSNRRQQSLPSFMDTPSNSESDQNNQESLNYLEQGVTPSPQLEDSQLEGSLTMEKQPSTQSNPNKKSMGNNGSAPCAQSLEYIDSPSRDSEHRSSIFLRDVESEIDEIKKDLEVEYDPNIHFIKGNFYHQYIEGDILGEGTTGTVKKCIRASDNEAVAVKIVHYRDDLEILTLIVKEFKNHRRLNHKNIIKVYDLYVDYFKKKIYTVMELAECREMFEVLQDLGHYSEAVASGIFKQILTGINYLHQNGVCHRDLKPNNILVSEDGKIVKITDFNVSKFVENKFKKFSFLSKENYKMWTYTGTISFTAPEVFNDNEYTECVDMWSAGVVLYTMLCGYQPFHAEYVQDLIEKIKKGDYEFPSDPWDNISKQAKNLVKRCLDSNYKTRCSPSEALMHPWIANCGKIPNTNIPRTISYLNTIYQKNAMKRNQSPTKQNRINANPFAIFQPNPTKTCDKVVSKNFDFKMEDEEIPDENPDGIPKQRIEDLQPKRGKTGPGGVQGFQPNFLLRLEKSFSFSVLEDTRYYYYHQYQKYTETDKEYEEEDEGIPIKNPGLIKGMSALTLKEDSSSEGPKGKNEWLFDITNSKLKLKQDQGIKNTGMQEGKENNDINQANVNAGRIWIDNNLYSEPLQMQD